MRLSLIAATFLIVTPALARPFTAEDLVNLDRISDPHLSPDGNQVAYDLRTTDLAKNKGVHTIWLVRTDAAWGDAQKPAKLAASEGGASHPRWSPDGKAIYFLSARGGSPQVWRADVPDGKPVQATNLALPVGEFALAPDGHTLVVAMAVFADCETPACTRQRLDARHADRASGQLYDHLFVRHWDEWEDGTRNHLFALKLGDDGVAAGGPVPLMPHFDGDAPTKPFGGDEDFAISPDSRTLIFSARQAGRTEPWSTNFDLYQVPLDGSAAPQDITKSNPAWDAAPVYSPNGKYLAYKAMRRPGFEADRFGIMLRELATGATREVAAGWDHSADALAWETNASLLVTADDDGRHLLYRIDTTTGAPVALTRDGHVAGVTVAGKRVVYARDSLAAPDELFKLEGSGTSRLTNRSAEQLVGVEMGRAEQFAFAGWNNETVHGYVMQPSAMEPNKKYPVAFIVHGGPQGSFGDSWSYRWNPEYYAGLGYGVVFIDFHGSTGYGQNFTDSISGHWGDRPLEDLQKGWQAALDKYPFLDGNRACALGASYGGFMIYWMAGVWNAPFKCFVDHDGVFDNRMMGYSTEELWFSEWENGHVKPWQVPEDYERFNPVNQVGNWDKPMLVVHSAQDFRIPLEQGLAAFTALQQRGIASEFLTFPDENHWVLKPANSLQWHHTVAAWLQRWMR